MFSGKCLNRVENKFFKYPSGFRCQLVVNKLVKNVGFHWENNKLNA